MPRRTWPGDGVGRGNGAGSQRTQYKPDMPSGNPHGRPRKPKLAPDASLKDAALSVMLEQVVTTENGVKRKQPRVLAMMKLLLADFPEANIREKLSIFKYLNLLVPQSALERTPGDLNRMSIDDFVKILAAEGIRDAEVAGSFDPPWRKAPHRR